MPPINAAIAPISLTGIRAQSIAYVSLGLCGGSAEHHKTKQYQKSSFHNSTHIIHLVLSKIPIISTFVSSSGRI